MKNFSQVLKSLTLALILVGGMSYVFAWTGPSASAPNGNVSAPINVGSTSQSKNGALSLGTSNPPTVGYSLDVTGAGVFSSGVASNQFCLGTNCITSWPSSGTSLASVGSCPTNQYLQGFDSNGNKICKFVYQIAGATENSGRGAYAYPPNLALATCPAGFYAHQVLGYPDLDGSLYLCLNY